MNIFYDFKQYNNYYNRIKTQFTNKTNNDKNTHLSQGSKTIENNTRYK